MTTLSSFINIENMGHEMISSLWIQDSQLDEIAQQMPLKSESLSANTPKLPSQEPPRRSRVI